MSGLERVERKVEEVGGAGECEEGWGHEAGQDDRGHCGWWWEG